jgi:ubiquinone biosynthesis protein UbiJ
MKKKTKRWNNFSTDEKLEALRDDVNSALDMVEALTKRIEKLETAVNKPSRE